MYRVEGGPAESSVVVDMPAGSPAFAAWVSAGRPIAESFTDMAGAWCACCGANHLPVQPAHQVVSRKFTDADSWPYDSGWLCAACGWAYTTPALRRSVYRLHQQPADQVVRDRSQLGVELTHGALAVDTAVVIPVRGRRHIVPTAQWGHVCTDDTCIRWDENAAELLAALRWLRAQPGVQARDLASPTPPIRLVSGPAAPEDRMEVWERWEALRPWREGSETWWEAALALSSPRKETAA